MRCHALSPMLVIDSWRGQIWLSNKRAVRFRFHLNLGFGLYAHRCSAFKPAVRSAGAR